MLVETFQIIEYLDKLINLISQERTERTYNSFIFLWKFETQQLS